LRHARSTIDRHGRTGPNGASNATRRARIVLGDSVRAIEYLGGGATPATRPRDPRAQKAASQDAGRRIGPKPLFFAVDGGAIKSWVRVRQESGRAYRPIQFGVRMGMHRFRRIGAMTNRTRVRVAHGTGPARVRARRPGGNPRPDQGRRP
jgi:hypothetical protein